MALTSASASGGPSAPPPKLSSAPGPPSRSARDRSRASAASILPASAPAIRYAGLMALPAPWLALACGTRAESNRRLGRRSAALTLDAPASLANVDRHIPILVGAEGRYLVGRERGERTGCRM